MKPAPFAYHRATSAEHAAALLDGLGPEARVLAGGQSLVPSMNLRLMTPPHVIDIGGVGTLAFIRREGARLVIGAMTRQSTVEESPLVSEAVPLLAEAVRHVAHPPIRHRGTVVGSIAHASAVAELPAVALALDADIVVQGVAGCRTVAASEFFIGPFATSRGADELVVEVRFPVAGPGHGWAWRELSPRNGNFPFAGAGVALAFADGVIERAAVALCGISDRPVRATAAEQALVGERWTPDLLTDAAALVVEGIAPRPDNDVAAHIVPVRANSVASWSYRTKVARTQARLAMAAAVDRAFRTEGDPR
ncbi:FAD binding domain-containing protein [Nocardioides humi]|uniref:Xanthine dehydrogenase family protein subunit M n=1 Tax=Nocardioides humi TaxID=449461 RepID=A0ABN2BXE2_9ACTN|nr:xanthine dehydrogenase family protein subunit M [Nocardioides humi]